jgi:tape measure domain-containing protein
MADGGSVIFKFVGDTKGLESSTTKAKGAVGTLAKSFTIAQIASTAFNKAIGTISKNMGSAISRLDTLNNYPKVMTNLGISAEDAEKSISKMSDKLAGLPTTLDSASLSVQRFTSANGDVQKSTDYFLALNNAILAGGASAEIQASAMEQLSQAYAKGKPDAMEWRSRLTAMPAQLKQVAEYMGYTSTAVGGDLYEALQKGKISMDDFMNAIVELNTNGSGNFQSFEEQARNSTGGIGTSITVAKTQIVKGLTDIMKSIDKSLKDKGLGGIGDIIANIGKVAKDAMDKIAEKMPEIIDFMTRAYDIINKLSPVILAVVAGIITYNTVVGMATTAMSLFNAVLALNPIGLIVAGIVALVAGFVLLWNKCEGFRNFFIGMWNAISPAVIAFKEAIKSLLVALEPVFNFIKEQFIKQLEILKEKFDIIVIVAKFLWQVIGQVFSGVVNIIVNFWTKTIQAITGVINWFKKLATNPREALNDLKNAVVNILGSLPGKMLSIGKNIVEGIWNGIKNAGNWIKEKVKEFAKGILDGMKRALGIHSPSTLFRDVIGKNLALGIGVGFEDEMSNVSKDINNSMKDIIPDINSTIGDMFDLSPTLNNNTSSSSNVTVKVYNNMETDMMGNLINNIRTFSNGAKNDYNYGMA